MLKATVIGIGEVRVGFVAIELRVRPRAVVSIVQESLAGVLVLPAASVAVTLKVWVWFVVRPLYVFGLVQEAALPPSIWQEKLDPTFVDVKMKLAVVWFVGFAGWPVIFTTGGTVSIVQESLAGVLVLPAASVAVTLKVWVWVVARLL